MCFRTPGTHWRAIQHEEPICDLRLPRKVRSILDKYATPRLFIYPGWKRKAHIRLELLAQLVLFAAKHGCMRWDPRDDLAVQWFRDYVSLVWKRWKRDGDGMALDAAADRVFMRLIFGAKVGKGFLAPQSGEAFESYVRKAIRGALADGRRTSGQLNAELDELPSQVAQNRLTGVSGYKGRARRGEPIVSDAVPETITEAAALLKVNPSTVWRRMKKMACNRWSPEVWPKLREHFDNKRTWTTVMEALKGKGVSHEAARKRVSRWRKAGRKPHELLAALSKGG